MMKKVLLWFLLFILLFTMVSCNTTTPGPGPEPEPEPEEPINYGTTYNRAHASYYEPGVPLIEDAHVVYINFDGFARYYYDEFVKEVIDEYTPTLKSIIDSGVGFKELRNALPSITNPCQNMVLTGATSAVTKNVYRYYDKKTNVVVQQLRENANKSIIDMVIESDMQIASVLQYLAGEGGRLTPDNPKRLYVYGDTTTNPEVVARAKGNDHFARIKQAEKLLTLQPVNTGSGNKVTLTSLPQFTMIYCDDLDSIGHNEAPAYGYTRSLTEAGRMENVITLIKDMDKTLEGFLNECKAKGVYDDLTFFLTTDHGMTPFGSSSGTDSAVYRTSKFGELKQFLKSYNSTYNAEMVAVEKSPSSAATVVAMGANVNLQLTFKNGITDEELEDIKGKLEDEYYVYAAYTRKDLEEQGYWLHDTDMIVVPAEKYHFSISATNQYIARAQHDSAQDSASIVYGAIFGKGIKQGYTYEDRAFNYDFGTTMAAALGLVIPNANGVVLDVFDR